MRRVGINVLKRNLSEYLRLAEAGEEILVTRHDRVVTRITSARARDERSAGDSVLDELTRKGLLRPALRPPGPVPRALGLVPTGELLAALDRDRRER